MTPVSYTHLDVYKRQGHGYDVHRLKEGRRLIIGGVELEYDRGLDGHSDADVLVHAVMDACLLYTSSGKADDCQTSCHR